MSVEDAIILVNVIAQESRLAALENKVLAAAGNPLLGIELLEQITGVDLAELSQLSEDGLSPAEVDQVFNEVADALLTVLPGAAESRPELHRGINDNVKPQVDLDDESTVDQLVDDLLEVLLG